MSVVCLIAAIAGAALGERYRVYALLPAGLIIITLTMITGIWAGRDLGGSAIASILPVLFLQAAYLAAAALPLKKARRPVQIRLPDPSI